MNFPETSSKWFNHYLRLITNARSRLGDANKKKAKSLLGDCHRHHVLPKCLGGINDQNNLVWLTPREHYIAHLLLHKSFPHIYGLLAAIFKMKQYAKSNRVYQTLCEKQASAQSERGKLNKGRRFTEEHKRNISLSNTGKTLSKESRNKIREKAFLRPPPSPETRSKNSQSMKKWHATHQHPLLGTRFSDEAKALKSQQNSGSGNPMFGKNHSDTGKQNISEGNKRWYETHDHPMLGKKQTESSKEKNRQKALNRERVICPWCNREGPKPNMVQHHFDKCKLKPSYNGPNLDEIPS